MDTKLTLKLDRNVIDRAKTYARKKNISLSQLIETYLNYLTTTKSESGDITPLVKSISGVVNLPKDFDYKKSYKNHILKKYSQ